jgi:membrane-associated phospholipid phosphatase
MIRMSRMVRARFTHRLVIAAVIVLIAKAARCQDPVGGAATDSCVGSDPAAVVPLPLSTAILTIWPSTSAGVDFASRGTWKHLYKDVVRDEGDVLRFPRKIGKHWVPFVVLTAATAGLIVLDPTDTPTFRRTNKFAEFGEVASGFNTGAAMAAIPTLFYVTRAKAHDSYGKQTVFMAAEAIADVQIVTLVAKMIDRRIRPVDVAPGGDYADTWFKADVLGGKSFPSGHTITAFALADVFVERYPEHRWIPWVAYGLAATVGFSRLTLQAHFPSDVFAGAALGILMTRGLVLHRSR